MQERGEIATRDLDFRLQSTSLRLERVFVFVHRVFLSSI